ncbi:hypothetical protein CHS0354_008218 [Potamilus streckersoni]|uniref:DUF547 domain-containing protein n=1 Tax=Potamilus streckersoni TaxID=2493646 RepID=A0AAE0RWG7_9BIVA|nr:hypothetical protein CHS0354_008218 [Potamilus streckersoni]
MASTTDVQFLNLNKTPDSGIKPAVELSNLLQKMMLRLKGDYMTPDGKGVDYKKLKESQLFRDYKEQAAHLQDVNLDFSSEQEKKAFFINIYNALTIHGLVEQDELPSSVLQIQQFWKKTGYKIGGYIFSLDDMEHGVLRGNRSHPASTLPHFENNDPRLKFIVKQLDPRIHFALVCGAKSCPAINVYTADNLDMALDAATRSFCAQEISISLEGDEIWLSKIFQWYQKDFGHMEVDVIRWTEKYLEPNIKDRAHILGTKLETLGNISVKYSDYDWKLNNIE